MTAVAEFDTRLRRIEKTRRRLQKGQKPKMRKDGLVTMRPVRQFRLPTNSILIIGIFAFCFKALLMNDLGPEAYAAKLDALKSGTNVEQVGVWLMQPDPVSSAIAERIAFLID